jgi:hypothetical protein
MLRKYMLAGAKEEDVIRKGFGSSSIINTCLSPLRYLDFIPTFGITGTSSFLLAQKLNDV